MNMEAGVEPPVYVFAYLEFPNKAMLSLFKAKERVDIKTAIYHRALSHLVYPFSIDYKLGIHQKDPSTTNLLGEKHTTMGFI